MSAGLLLGGGSVLSGILGGKGAKKAANAQVDLGKQALALQQQMYEQSRADLAPWREAGGQAIGQGLAMLQPGYDYTASPGYQWRLSQGLGAVQNSAAAKGLLMSGGTLKDLNNYAQGAAAADFNDQFNREMAIAGGGQQAVNTGVQAAQNYASGATSTLNGIGNAKASGYGGQTQAINGTLNNLIGLYGMGAFSDRRLKTNIERIGDWDDRGDGLGRYRWNWKADPDGPTIEGVLADEVKELRPQAYIENYANGYDGVNYAALGVA